MLDYLRLYGLLGRTFGWRARPIATFGLLQAQHAMTALGFAADRLLSPGIERRPIERPIFILGNPRSGTTFVHRFLLNTEELAAFRLWEMLFPALCERKLFGGVVDRFAPLSPARYHSGAAHETSLRDVETDDAYTFFHFVDGGFLWSYYWAWEDSWGSPLARAAFELEAQSAKEKERYFRYLEAGWRRNLVFQNKPRVIAKASTLSLRVPSLLERYPDCKLVYLSRDPLETIPSGMSLLTGVLENSYDMWNATTEAARARYLENLYQGSCELYRGFHKVWQEGRIPEKNLRIVPYSRLMNDLEATMLSLLDFLELSPAPSFYAKLREQAEKQLHRRSEHKYDLAKFALDEARIKADLEFVYRDFGV